MGMTDKQFKAFLRLSIKQLEKAVIKSPDNEEIKEMLELYQAMLED